MAQSESLLETPIRVSTEGKVKQACSIKFQGPKSIPDHWDPSALPDPGFKVWDSRCLGSWRRVFLDIVSEQTPPLRKLCGQARAGGRS